MKWVYQECRRGDIIRVKLGSVYHYGIFVSDDEVIAFGLPPTAENLKRQEEIRVLSTDIDAFSCGRLVETASLSFMEKRRRNSPEKTVSLAKARMGEGGYSLIHNNCEHFVNEVVFGESYSEQEQAAREKWRKFLEEKNSRR